MLHVNPNLFRDEMVQGPCAHLHLHETSTVVLDRLNVIIDRLNVISSESDSVCILPPRSPDAKVCFQGDLLAVIFEVRSGRN
jgi:hypothetical protein